MYGAFAEGSSGALPASTAYGVFHSAAQPAPGHVYGAFGSASAPSGAYGAFGASPAPAGAYGAFGASPAPSGAYGAFTTGPGVYGAFQSGPDLSAGTVLPSSSTEPAAPSHSSGGSSGASVYGAFTGPR
jgi:hypothetical protein